jgi:putative ABC transport system permease protein
MMMTLMTRLNDFLGLASLVALFLSAVSSGFLFRSYFRKQMKSMAILMSLGLSRTQALIYSISQVSILGFVSSLFAFFLSIGVIQALDILTRELLPFQVQYGFDLSAMGFCFLVGTLGSVLLSLPILIATRHIRPIFLINGFQSHSQSPFWERALASLPGIALFTWMSIDLSNSYQIGGLFTGLFFASSLILAGLALLFFKSAEKFTPKISLGLSWALRDLARKPASTLTGFVAIGLGSLLLNLIPQIQTTLQSELDRPEQSKLPSLFMFDIQEEQLPSFQSILKEQNVEVDQISPMIRARLLTVNEKEFDKGEGMNEELTREQESEMRFRNRGFNLSYRSEFSESESLEEGVPFSGTYDESSGELPQISVEERFAGRLGLKVGDILKFDIESIPIVGKIVNLRKVQWTSFRPNFFVQFQPGVLEMAPKTFVATAPFLSLERKYQLQDRLVEALPNISLVDVSRIVKRISEIMLQMSWALFAMSLLCLIAGFVVIYSIATHQASERGWEIGLLKALGAPFPSIRAQFFWQFGLVGFLALSFGAVLSLVISFLISSYLFESHWVFHYTTPLLSVVIGTLLSLGVTVFATSKALSAKTKDLFSAQ